MADEREVKLAVATDFVLPDLEGVAPGVHAADRGVHLLEATYWDTTDLRLLHSGHGLRHRTTDGREGTWTMKGRSRRDGAALVREELEVAGGGEALPEELRARLPSDVDAGELSPAARLRTERRVVDLVAGGGRWAEVADDRVTVLDGDRPVARFHEVEVEVIGAPDDARLDAVVERLRSAGAGEPAATSKYVQALQALGREGLS